MTTTAFATQLIAACAGVLLATCVLLVWRRGLRSAVGLVAAQGAAQAGIVVGTGLLTDETELFVVAGLVLVLKALVVPAVLDRGVRRGGADRDEQAALNPTAGLIFVALAAVLAYLVSRPVVEALTASPHEHVPAAASMPVALTMVLVGFLLLVTRRRAVSQLVGFMTLDNGIATAAFTTAAGVPLLVELGTSFELLLVVLILVVLTGRIRALSGAGALDRMRELRD
ncbi:MAG: hypothetical protein FWD11_08335 [Micrococcales bacterium]|nr:hypothetical protein [Micrococcales bacterium]